METRHARSRLTDLPELTPAEREDDSACIAHMAEKEARLQSIDPVLLALSIREPAVGIPLGHTLTNKLALLKLAHARPHA